MRDHEFCFGSDTDTDWQSDEWSDEESPERIQSEETDRERALVPRSDTKTAELSLVHLELSETCAGELKAKSPSERAALYLEELDKSEDAAGYTSTIISRLPDKVKIEADKQSVKLSFDSITKLLEAIPGMHGPDSRSLSDLKSIHLDGNKLKLDGSASFMVGNPADGREIKLTLTNASADLKIDSHDPTKITLTNFSGLTVATAGARVNVKELSISLVEDKDGNLSLKILPSKLEGDRAREQNNQLGALYNRLAAGVASTKLAPIEFAIGNKKDTPLLPFFGHLNKWIDNEKNRDAGALAETLAGMFLEKSLAGSLRGLKAIEKDGDRIIIKSDGGDLHSLGGIPIAWDKTISGKLGADGKKLEVKELQGLRIQMPLPGDLAASLGMKNPLEIPLQELCLGEADKDGNRLATIKCEGVIESLAIKVGPQLRPAPIDAAGNVAVNIVLNKDGRLPLEVVFDPKQAMAGDAKKVDFKLTVKGDSDNLPKVIEGFFGHTLDPVLQNALKGIESIEKKGDKITLKRKEGSSHELGGLRVGIAKEITFKIAPDDSSIKLSGISGLTIESLPGIANTIYKERLPIYLRSFDLGSAGRDGGRSMSIQASGAMRSANIKLDAAMQPQDIEVVVENPVQAIKETLQNSRAMGTLIQRTRGNDTYAIRIRSNGAVALGGLGNPSDMFSNAGDLHSPEGIAATVIGYAGQKLANPGSTKAERGLWHSVERTWTSVFGR